MRDLAIFRLKRMTTEVGSLDLMITVKPEATAYSTRSHVVLPAHCKRKNLEILQKADSFLSGLCLVKPTERSSRLPVYEGILPG